MKFECYIARLDGEVLYIGEGKTGRYKHCCSGLSHVYHLNRLHFDNRVIDVEVIPCETKEQAAKLEAEMIEKLSPKFNRVRLTGGIFSILKRLRTYKNKLSYLSLKYIIDNVGVDFSFLINSKKDPTLYKYIRRATVERSCSPITPLIKSVSSVGNDWYEFKLNKEVVINPLPFYPDKYSKCLVQNEQN